MSSRRGAAYRPASPGPARASRSTTTARPTRRGGRPATTHANGTVFRIIEFAPGNAERNHRTDSLDYAVVLSGEIDMDLDGAEIHLKAGDAIVQRGTIHNWINRGTEPCVIAFVLIAAHPAVAGGKTLPAVG